MKKELALGMMRLPQTTDKACKRKNLCERKEIGRDFCLLCWQRLQNAVTYNRVSSLFCRLAALPCRLSQRPASLLTLSIV